MKGTNWSGLIYTSLPALGILLGAVLPWVVYCGLVLHQPVVEVDGTAPIPWEESQPTQDMEGEASVAIEGEGYKLVALTFDDGPKASTTLALLDGLSQRGCQATFFLIGSQIVGNEAIILRMEAEGHQIGLHSYDHVMLTDLNQLDFDSQVAKERNLLQSILGYDSFMLRPPYGLYDTTTQLWAQCPIILWSVDPEDWKGQGVETLVADVLEQVEDGDIILMHDIFDESVEAALAIVDGLLAQGYHLCTVETLFQAKGVEPIAGNVYCKGSEY